MTIERERLLSAIAGAAEAVSAAAAAQRISAEDFRRRVAAAVTSARERMTQAEAARWSDNELARRVTPAVMDRLVVEARERFRAAAQAREGVRAAVRAAASAARRLPVPGAELSPDEAKILLSGDAAILRELRRLNLSLLEDRAERRVAAMAHTPERILETLQRAEGVGDVILARAAEETLERLLEAGPQRRGGESAEEAIERHQALTRQLEAQREGRVDGDLRAAFEELEAALGGVDAAMSSVERQQSAIASAGRVLIEEPEAV